MHERRPPGRLFVFGSRRVSFVFWALTGGQKYGPKLLFQRIPKPVLVKAEKTLKQIHS